MLFFSLSVSCSRFVSSRVSMERQSFDTEHFATITIIISRYIKAPLYSFQNQSLQHPLPNTTHKHPVSKSTSQPHAQKIQEM